MATSRARRRPTPRLRFDALEPRETPATPALDFAAGFTADRLPGGAPGGYAAGDLVLTDGRDQARAVFAPSRVDVRAFRTSFVFRVDGPAGPKGDGFTFALTGDGRQAAMTAGGGTGEGLGYQGLTDSVAVKFDLVDNAGEGANSVGVFTGGAAPTAPAVSLDGTGIDLHSGHAYRADLHYVGPDLTLTLTDLADPARTWTHDFAVDIPAAVGADTAYAGFTGGTGLLFARQAIESWTYTEGAPEAPVDQPPVITAPVRASWLSPGSAALLVEAADDGGPGNLTYIWEVVSAPAGAAPVIRPQPDGSAHVTLDRPGRHTFRVTVRDAGGLSATAEVFYSDPLRVTAFEVAPQHPTVRAGESVQFETLVRDAAGNRAPENLGATWRVVSGPGTIDAFGRYTAPIDASGPVTVEAEIPGRLKVSVAYWTARATVVVQGGFEGVDLARNGSARVTDGRLRLADGAHQAGSAYAPTPVDVRGFSTSFWFRIGDQPDARYGDGLTFVLQNAGSAALGAGGSGLGYEGIGQSVAVKFDLVDNAGEGPHSVGVFTNGAAPTLPADRLPDPPPGQGNGGILLNRGRVFRADLTYADGVLELRLTDTVTGHAFGREYAVDIPAAVGGPTAFAGFTAGTGELFAPIDVLKWTFTPADGTEPPPPTDDGAPTIKVGAAPALTGAGTITTVAGNGRNTYGGDGGPATSASLINPFGVAADAAGNLFIADQGNHRIRKVDAVTGVITTVAGNGAQGYNGDGIPATGAALSGPFGVAVDAAGNLFVADRSNHRIRKVDAVTGIITTVAGNGVRGYGGDGGPAAAANLGHPFGVAVDAAGNLFIADTGNGRVRRVDVATGVITTVAGDGSSASGYGVDVGDGEPATGATLNPAGVVVDAAGNLFIADEFNNRVRRVDAATGIITTVAGTGFQGYGGDGGPAASAVLFGPTGVALDAAGNLFIADTRGDRVRRVDAATGIITTVADSLHLPTGVALDAAGNLFIADNSNHVIRKVATRVVHEGDPAAYTFTVTNTSPASTDPVTVTSVVDTVLGDLTAAARAANGGADVVLARGASFTFSAAGPAQNAGPVRGTVTVSGHDDEGTPATATDSHTLTVTDAAPALAVRAVAITGTISTVAGIGVSGYAGDGGPAAQATLGAPHGVAVDAAGNLFIADRPNSRVRRVDAATGVITTVAGNGRFGYTGDNVPATEATLGGPAGVAVDAAGNLFIADFSNSRVRRVDAATGVITTVAGNSTAGFGGDGGPATSASLNFPDGVAVDAAGNLYIADTGNQRVRRVDAATGVIKTVAGTGTHGFGGDGGPATEAQLWAPVEVAVDADGNLYIADGHNLRVRRVDADTGVITTVAGNGTFGYAGDDGPATSAPLNSPTGLAVDDAGNLYIANMGNHRVRRVDADTGVITTVAGNGTRGYGGDGGPAAAAALHDPSGVAVDAAGNLFIADTFNYRVRKVATTTVPEGQPAAYTFTITNTSPAATDPVTVTAIADTRLGDLTAAARAANGGADVVVPPGQSFTFTHTAGPPNAGPATGVVTVAGHDDEGTPAAATASHAVTVTDVPPAVTVDKAVPAATITTVAGTGVSGYGGDGGPATAALLASPHGVAVDAAGNLFIGDYSNNRVRRVDAATGAITTVAGSGVAGYGGDGGPATAAALLNPVGVAADAAGNLFVADYANNRVRRVDAVTGVITTVAGNGTFGYGGDGGPATAAALTFPQGVTVDAAGNVFIADTGNRRIRRVDAATGVITTVAGNGTEGFSGDGGPATGAALWLPSGVAVDLSGHLFIADQGNARVRRVDVVTGVITTVAGTGNPGYAGDGGPATAAALSTAEVEVDAAGNLYIADGNHRRVRRVDAATGVITTVAGTGAAGDSGDGGPATAALLVSPRGVAVDAAGNLFIADQGAHRVRKVGVAVKAGDPVAYTFTIRNTSPASTDPVTVTSIADDHLGELIGTARAANGGSEIVLAPGEAFTFSASGPLDGPGTVVTTVTVTANDDEGRKAIAGDTETVTVT